MAIHVPVCRSVAAFVSALAAIVHAVAPKVFIEMNCTESALFYLAQHLVPERIVLPAGQFGPKPDVVKRMAVEDHGQAPNHRPFQQMPLRSDRTKDLLLS